jgi:5-hydroxyisourate hydrolase-like protein (transthyretin family)
MRFIIFISIILVAALGTATAEQKGTAAQKSTVASISGRITIDGKPASGVTVQLLDHEQPSLYLAETVTDREGLFKLDNLADGNYKLLPLVPDYFIKNEETIEQPGKKVKIVDGEPIKDLEITLERGGVITGHVTDYNGEPIIGSTIDLSNIVKIGIVDASIPISFTTETDDRGFYRLYGLPSGRYAVKATINITGNKNRSREAFHPDVKTHTEATTVEVTAGNTTENIDITFKQREPQPKSYKVTGRIVNAKDGKPAANIQINYRYDEVRIVNLGFSKSLYSNPMGEFEINDISPGKYVIYVMPDFNKFLYSETVPFEVFDSDVKGLEIKLCRGASIKGTVVVKNADDPAILAQIKEQRFTVRCQTQETDRPFHNTFSSEADGSFKIEGLPPGKATISITENLFVQSLFSLLNIELNSSEQKDGIDISPDEQVTDVRIVLGYYTGSIRGQIIVNGGTLPADAQMIVSITNPTGVRNFHGRLFKNADSSGRFLFERLEPGNYKVTFSIFPAISISPQNRSEQFVTVYDGKESNVTFNVNLNREESKEEEKE